MIIVIKEQDRVVVGYSNTDYWNKLTDKDYVDEENVAIKFTDDGTIFACPMMNALSDLILYDDEILSMNVDPKNIVREIIPSVKETLSKNGKPLDKDGCWKNNLFIIRNNRAFQIDNSFRFSEIDDSSCKCSMGSVLRSVLDATQNLPAEDRILKAVNFASTLYKESLFPIVITDTKTKKFKYIYEGEKSSGDYNFV